MLLYDISSHPKLSQDVITNTYQDAPPNHTQNVAPITEETGSNREVFSGQGSAGPTNSGSGKGGHEPKTLGQNKGIGAQGV